MSLPAHMHIVTLGVADLPRSVAFYSALGWQQAASSQDEIAWFRTSGAWLGLFGYDALAADAGFDPDQVGAAPAYRGVAIAINRASEAEVDAGLAAAEACGARIVKLGERLDWGGYSGYFADPDGHLWEVAYNPNFPLTSDGRIEIP